jgi:L-arabinonolactonase
MLIQRLDVPVSVLGEGPVWSERDHCLYFVDIMSKRVQAYWPADRRHKIWQFDEYAGALAECRSGGLIVALNDRVVRFDPNKGPGSVEPIAVLERDRPQNRLNDGKVDPWGRFWVGSMQIDETAANGRLWCVTASGDASLYRDGIGVPNSLAFDEKRGTMYFADSFSRTIEQNALDSAGVPTAWSPFSKTIKGNPDGSCVDAEGYLWNAEWGGSCIVRHSPSGEIDRVIEMPVSRPSSCTFGGVDFTTLFVTSARYNMSDAERDKEAHAGSLYSIELDDVRGLRAPYFAL